MIYITNDIWQVTGSLDVKPLVYGHIVVRCSAHCQREDTVHRLAEGTRMVVCMIVWMNACQSVCVAECMITCLHVWMVDWVFEGMHGKEGRYHQHTSMSDSLPSFP